MITSITENIWKNTEKKRAAIDSGFTHYYICHRLGTKNSRSYFNDIIRGRKNIGAETIQKLIDLLELTNDQDDYFRALVNYDQTRVPGDRKYYFDQIVALNNTPRKLIDESTYRYFTTWYHPVVRELLDTFDFNNNYEELAKKTVPPITARQAKESIEMLTSLNLINKDSRGFLKPNDRIISTSDSVQHHLVEQYQLYSLERARDRITNGNKDHKTGTMTVAVSPEGLKHILDHLSRFRSAVRSIAHKDTNPDKKVYEVIMHIHTQSQ